MKTARLCSLLAVLVLPFAGGCSDDGTVYDSITALKPGGAAYGYVLNEAAASTLLQFSLASSGAVMPTATLTLPGTFQASAVAVDPKSGTLYVGGVDTTALTSEILVYPAGSAGVAAPSATILPVGADFAEPLAMTVDASGKIYVVSTLPAVGTGNDTPIVAVLASGSTGAAAAVKVLSGPSTGLYSPTGIAVDASGDVYVSNADTGTTPYSGSIAVFSASATGNTAPLRAITNINQIFNGVAVDAQQNIYATLETLTVTNKQNVYSNASIVEFAAGTSGAAAPAKTVSGALTGLAAAGNILVDAAGNFYVVNETTAAVAGSGSLLGFSPAAAGNEAPAVTITSSAITAGASEFAIK